MMEMKCLIFTQLILTVLFTGCSGQQIAGHRSNQLNAINAHQVSVKVALDLAKSSFISGCTKALHTAGIKKVFYDCAREADIHVREIESILKPAAHHLE
jgi:hypothetical protein